MSWWRNPKLYENPDRDSFEESPFDDFWMALMDRQLGPSIADQLVFDEAWKDERAAFRVNFFLSLDRQSDFQVKIREAPLFRALARTGMDFLTRLKDFAVNTVTRPIRLKKLQDLLARTDIGKEGYTISRGKGSYVGKSSGSGTGPRVTETSFVVTILIFMPLSLNMVKEQVGNAGEELATAFGQKEVFWEITLPDGARHAGKSWVGEEMEE